MGRVFGEKLQGSHGMIDHVAVKMCCVERGSQAISNFVKRHERSEHFNKI